MSNRSNPYYARVNLFSGLSQRNLAKACLRLADELYNEQNCSPGLKIVTIIIISHSMNRQIYLVQLQLVGLLVKIIGEH